METNHPQTGVGDTCLALRYALNRGCFGNAIRLNVSVGVWLLLAFRWYKNMGCVGYYYLWLVTLAIGLAFLDILVIKPVSRQLAFVVYPTTETSYVGLEDLASV